jgi:hypothetical protein
VPEPDILSEETSDANDRLPNSATHRRFLGVRASACHLWTPGNHADAPLDFVLTIHCDHVLRCPNRRLEDARTRRVEVVMKLSHNGHKLVS